MDAILNSYFLLRSLYWGYRKFYGNIIKLILCIKLLLLSISRPIFTLTQLCQVVVLLATRRFL